MKQIFDWLREAICEGSQCINERYYTTVVHSLSCVNEAEAKWEADCCVWKKNIYFFGGHDYSSGCGTRIPLNSLEYHKYCPFCGKPIKISEVE